MSVLADTHGVTWYLQGGGALSDRASRVLREAATTGKIVVSVATLVDLWYLGRKRRDFTPDQIRLVRDEVVNPKGDFAVAPINLGVIDMFEMIDSDVPHHGHRHEPGRTPCRERQRDHRRQPGRGDLVSKPCGFVLSVTPERLFI